MTTMANYRRDVIVNGKTYGIIIDDTFYRPVRYSTGLFRRTDSWSIDVDIWNSLFGEHNVERVVVVDREDERAYTISAAWFMASAVKDDNGAGEQYYVRRKYFDDVDYKEVSSWIE